jgi:hypothetical protein
LHERKHFIVDFDFLKGFFDKLIPVRGRYHIVRWVPERHYLIARNDSANRSAPGRWTRIDWLPLGGMPPYEWGFCFSAYAAPSAAAAESVTVARPETPRTGCNGYPYTRMRRIAGGR